MSVGKTAIAFAAVAVGLTLAAMISVLSVSNGQLRREIKTLRSRSGSEQVMVEDRLERMEAKVAKLDRQVQRNVVIANRNYERYNLLVRQISWVMQDARRMSKTQLLAAIKKIQDPNVKVSDIKRLMEKEKG